MSKPAPPHRLLPAEAIASLQRAARTSDPFEPMTRIRAIDHAVSKIKKQHPQLFKES